MKTPKLIEEVVVLFSIAWLFWLLFYFNYAIISGWFVSLEFNYQENSKIFGYIAALYLGASVFVLVILNQFIISRSKLANRLLQSWSRISVLLKISIVPLSFYAFDKLYPVSQHAI